MREAARLSRRPLPWVRLQQRRHEALQGRRAARGLQAATQSGAGLCSTHELCIICCIYCFNCNLLNNVIISINYINMY